MINPMIARTGFDQIHGREDRSPIPLSDAALELEELRASLSLAGRPQSINPDTLPPALRDSVLKALGERGDAARIGMLPRGSFGMLRKGSVRFDEKEAKEKQDFINRLIISISQDYLDLYKQTAYAVYRAEIQVEGIIDVLRESIRVLEDDADSTFTKVAPPEGAKTLTSYKKEIENFRDTKLKQYRKTLEDEQLPTTESLTAIQKDVEKKVSRFNEFAKKAIVSAGRVIGKTGKVAGELVGEAISNAYLYAVGKYKTAQNDQSPPPDDYYDRNAKRRVIDPSEEEGEEDAERNNPNL